MDFKYSFKDRGIFGLRMEIVPNEYIKGNIIMINSWLEGDIHKSDTIYNYMKSFMENPEMKEANFGGNSCDVFANREYATIQWEWHDQVPDSCTLPTQMLYEILQIWVAKQNELREEERLKEEEKENK